MKIINPNHEEIEDRNPGGDSKGLRRRRRLNLSGEGSIEGFPLIPSFSFWVFGFVDVSIERRRVSEEAL